MCSRGPTSPRTSPPPAGVPWRVQVGLRGRSVAGGTGSVARGLAWAWAVAAWALVLGMDAALAQMTASNVTDAETSAPTAAKSDEGSDAVVYGLPTPLPGIMSLAQFITMLGMTMIFIAMGVLYMTFGVRVANRERARKLWAKVKAGQDGALGVGVGGLAVESDVSSGVSSSDSSEDEEEREERRVRREEHKKRVLEKDLRREARRAAVQQKTAKFAANAFGKRVLQQAALDRAEAGQSEATTTGQGTPPMSELPPMAAGVAFTVKEQLSSSEADSEEHSAPDDDEHDHDAALHEENDDGGGGVGDLGLPMDAQDSAVRQLFPESNKVAPVFGESSTAPAARGAGDTPSVVPKGWKLVRQESMKPKPPPAMTLVVNKKGKRVIRMPKGGRLGLAFEGGAANPCYRDLIDALARYHYARVSFKAAGVANLDEIKRMGFPLPGPVQIVLQAVCLLLGEERSEKNRKKLLSKKGMKFSAVNHLRRNTPRRMSFSVEEINARLRHPRNLFYTEIVKMELEGTYLLGSPVSAIRMRLGDMVFDTQAVCEEMPCCARILAWIKAVVNLCVVLEDVPDVARDMAFEMCHKAGGLRKVCHTAEELQLGSKALHRASIPRTPGDMATTDEDVGPMDSDSDASSPRDQLGRIL